MRSQMAQIFVSHSQRDKDIIHFLLEAFAGTKVKPHLEELEKKTPSGVTAEKLSKDILASNSIFVLLSENVQQLEHTRDWINWECGTANNKEIWVFEPAETLGKVRVVVPRFNHYVLFEKTDEWRDYLRSIIESYDDSHVIPVLSASTAGGASIHKKDPATGALVGFAVGIAGLILKDIAKPSMGIAVRCPKCSSNYNIHRYGAFRCAVCNTDVVFHPPQTKDAVQ